MRNGMLVLRFALSGLVLWIFSLGVACSTGLPDAIEKIRGSIVAVGTVTSQRRSIANYRGTGFAVGNGNQVITNYHVLPEILDTAKKESLAVFVGRGRKAKARQVKILRTDPDHDLALLEISGAPLVPLQLGQEKLTREGNDVAFTGFPVGPILGLYPVTHKAIISAITPIVIPAASSKTLTAERIKRLKKPFEVYQLDGTAYPGNSGSPVYEIESGRVIGVINSVFVKGSKESGLERPSGISYAIPARYIKKLLVRGKN